MTKSRHVAPPRRYWTDHELAVMRATYADTPTKQIAAQLGRSEKMVYSKAKNIGLRKSEAYLASEAACRLRQGDAVGYNHRFKRGGAPWNKGLKGATGTHPRTVAHHFKPGNRPHTWVPVGSTRIADGCYLQRKLSDTGYAPRDWVSVHRHVWEAAHGPVPKGSVVVFKPGRHTTDEARITLDALECITRRELVHRNSVHRHGPELQRLSQLRGAITRQINRRLRAQQEQESSET